MCGEASRQNYFIFLTIRLSKYVWKYKSYAFPEFRRTCSYFTSSPQWIQNPTRTAIFPLKLTLFRLASAHPAKQGKIWWYTFDFFGWDALCTDIFVYFGILHFSCTCCEITALSSKPTYCAKIPLLYYFYGNIHRIIWLTIFPVRSVAHFSVAGVFELKKDSNRINALTEPFTSAKPKLRQSRLSRGSGRRKPGLRIGGFNAFTQPKQCVNQSAPEIQDWESRMLLTP